MYISLKHHPNSAQLRFFILDPTYRGMGLGKKLMNFFMEEVYERNYPHCFLWTAGELDAAIGLYTRHGFNKTEEMASLTFGRKVIEQKFEWTKT